MKSATFVVEGVEELLPLVDVGGTGSLMLPAAVMGSHLLARRTTNVTNVKAKENNQIANENTVSLCVPHTRATHTYKQQCNTHTTHTHSCNFPCQAYVNGFIRGKQPI